MAGELLTVRVREVVVEAVEVRSFVLEAEGGALLPAYTPGAHIDVHLGEGLVRQYSLCGDPADRGAYRISVKREPQSRGGSRALHERVRTEDQLRIGVPRNNFALKEDAATFLLVAGGIGITPLLAMAQHLLSAGRPFELLYFTRSIAHTAYHALLSGPAYGGRVQFHYALEPDAVRTYLRRRLWHHDAGTHLYLCGPRPFMDLVEQTAAATWPPEHVHLEYFTADPRAFAGPRGAFRVRLARTGGEYEIAPERSIVAVLADHGIVIDTSCEQGVCGTCLTGVIEGTPDHRDAFLTEEERLAGDKLCPCVSRAKSETLVLDL